MEICTIYANEMAIRVAVSIIDSDKYSPSYDNLYFGITLWGYRYSSNSTSVITEIYRNNFATCVPPFNVTYRIIPVSEMTYTVSSGTLNPSIPYHTL